MSDPEESLVDAGTAAPYAGAEAYAGKSFTYFTNARWDYVSELPEDAHARVLEIGCGGGETGALALAEGRCGSYCGVEVCRPAAEKAVRKITEVIVGNVEELQLPWGPATFDAVILSEVLEHLADPWMTLSKVLPLLKRGASVYASSPNVAHYRVVSMLVRGEWALSDFGPMDRTHLRWFTPLSYRRLFESCGYAVDSVRGLVPLGRKARVVNALTLGWARHLLIRQIDLRAHRP